MSPTAARWARSLALLLVGVMLMQGVPFHALMGAHGAEACPCAQKGYCAWSPGEGASCTCAHHDHDAPAHHDQAAHHGAPGADDSPAPAMVHAAPASGHGPSLQACGDMEPDTPAVMILLKAALQATEGATAQAWTPEPQALVTALATQRISNDVFRPPQHRIG